MIVIFTRSATFELLEIEAYVAADDAIAAERLTADLVDACMALEDAPERGPVIGSANGLRLRRLVHGQYLILYSVSVELVRIHRVVHGARSPRARLKGLDPF